MCAVPSPTWGSFLLFSSSLPMWEGKAPCLPASTKGHPSSPQATWPPVGYFICSQERGQSPELTTVGATEEIAWAALLALQQHRQGWKHGPEHGSTQDTISLRKLCNKTTRNLLSFMARKKLWLRKMHWLPTLGSWLLVSVSIYVWLKTITRPWTLRCAALRKCSTKEKKWVNCAKKQIRPARIHNQVNRILVFKMLCSKLPAPTADSKHLRSFQASQKIF